MFSFQKIAVFVIILAVIWLGFRFVGNLEKQRKAQERLARPSWRERFRRSAARTGANRAREAAREPAAEVDMVPCRVCGDYVAGTGARSCGRQDCPYAPAA
jgi:hypothetical protein